MSLSRNGNCSDNAPLERFFSSLKNELQLSNLASFFSLCPLFLPPQRHHFSSITASRELAAKKSFTNFLIRCSTALGACSIP